MSGCYRQLMKKLYGRIPFIGLLSLNGVLVNASLDHSVTTVTTYRSQSTAGLYDCIAECQASSVCKSVVYKPDLCECGLRRTNVSTRDSTDAIYIDVTTWEIDLAGPGSRCSCPAYATCLLHRNGNTECIEESISCGDPPEVDNAHHEAQNESEYRANSIITYTCRKGFLNCGPMKRKCQKSGSWSRVKGHCVSSSVTFSGPKMSDRRFPCSKRPSWKMTVRGHPSAPDYLWLFAHRKSALVIQVRLNHDVCVDTINMAIKKQTECGTKVPNVFKTEKAFQIEISFSNKLYNLRVGHKQIKSVSGHNAGKLVVSGSVVLTSVTFEYS